MNVVDSSVSLQETGEVVLFTFHPISGKPDIAQQSEVHRLSHDVLGVVMLAQADEHYLRPLLLLDSQRQVACCCHLQRYDCSVV